MADDTKNPAATAPPVVTDNAPSGTVDTPAKVPGAKSTVDEETGIKIPADLTKVSDAKAKELVENGLVMDSDVPGKMYKRKHDGFVARLPNYTFNAYHQEAKDQWEEVKLVTEPDADQA